MGDAAVAQPNLAHTPSVAAGHEALMAAFGFPAIPADELARIEVPTTPVWGGHDAIVRLAVGQAASERHGWPLRVMDEVGNEPAIEDPQAFLAVRSKAVGGPRR